MTLNMQCSVLRTIKIQLLRVDEVTRHGAASLIRQRTCRRLEQY